MPFSHTAEEAQELFSQGKRRAKLRRVKGGLSKKRAMTRYKKLQEVGTHLKKARALMNSRTLQGYFDPKDVSTISSVLRTTSYTTAGLADAKRLSSSPRSYGVK